MSIVKSRPIVIFTAILLACVTTKSLFAADAADATNSEMAAVAEGFNHFAWNLYAKLAANNNGNLFFSPPSISTALAVTYAGARGDTATQMANVLNLDHRAEGQARLIKQFNDAAKKGLYQLNIVNRLWGQQGYTFLDSFLKTLGDTYHADLQQIDFSAQPEQARQAINTWVEQATEGKIKGLMPPGSVNDATKLVVTNAIYFKGFWENQFKKELTQPAPFFITPEKKVVVPLMFQQNEYRFGTATLPDGCGLKVLELPYKGDELAMVMLLPEKIDGVQVLEKQLTAANLKQWSANLNAMNVRIWLPRFVLTAGFQLDRVLSELGMPLAFDPGKADFSGMDGKQDLFIGAVVHKAYVDVNEEGTEAAAATGITMVPMARRIDSAEFRADHPFVFFIRDNHSGCILFMGRLNDPSGTEPK